MSDSTIHTCLACGYRGYDVAMKLVKVPLEEQRVVQAAIPVGETRRGVAGFEYQDVREQYANEPRCRDRKGCAERVRAQEPAKPIEAKPVIEEVEPWLL